MPAAPADALPPPPAQCLPAAPAAPPPRTEKTATAAAAAVPRRAQRPRAAPRALPTPLPPHRRSNGHRAAAARPCLSTDTPTERTGTPTCPFPPSYATNTGICHLKAVCAHGNGYFFFTVGSVIFMNKQYWGPQLPFIYLLYVSYSITYLTSPCWCISIRKPSLLQQQSKRTNFNQIKAHRVLRKKNHHRGPALSETSQAARWYRLPRVPALLCRRLLPDTPSSPDPFFWVLFCASLAKWLHWGTTELPEPTRQPQQKPRQQGGTGDSNPLHLLRPKTSLARPKPPPLQPAFSKS